MKLDHDLLLALALGAIVLLASATLWIRGRGSRRAKRRARRAVRGEARAAALLEDAGYTVIDNQVGGAVTITIDGDPHRFDVRADYLVERGGRRFVAEVKTGEVVGRLAHGATRRQLMEYALAFGADGVLLVTPEDGEVRAIGFPSLQRRALLPGPIWFTLGVLAGAGGAAYLTGG